MNEQPLLRVSDVARLTGYSEDSILRDIHAGLLPALRRPKAHAFLVRPEDYGVYLDRLKYAPSRVTKASAKASDAFHRRLRAIAGGRVR